MGLKIHRLGVFTTSILPLFFALLLSSVSSAFAFSQGSPAISSSVTSTVGVRRQENDIRDKRQALVVIEGTLEISTIANLSTSTSTNTSFPPPFSTGHSVSASPVGNISNWTIPVLQETARPTVSPLIPVPIDGSSETISQSCTHDHAQPTAEPWNDGGPRPTMDAWPSASTEATRPPWGPEIPGMSPNPWTGGTNGTAIPPFSESPPGPATNPGLPASVGAPPNWTSSEVTLASSPTASHDASLDAGSSAASSTATEPQTGSIAVTAAPPWTMNGSGTPQDSGPTAPTGSVANPSDADGRGATMASELPSSPGATGADGPAGPSSIQGSDSGASTGPNDTADPSLSTFVGANGQTVTATVTVTQTTTSITAWLPSSSPADANFATAGASSSSIALENVTMYATITKIETVTSTSTLSASEGVRVAAGGGTAPTLSWNTPYCTGSVCVSMPSATVSAINASATPWTIPTLSSLAISPSAYDAAPLNYPLMSAAEAPPRAWAILGLSYLWIILWSLLSRV